MYSYEIVYYIAKLLEPLVGGDRRRLTESQALTLSELRALVSKSWLKKFPRRDVYKYDPPLDKVLKVLDVFGMQIFSGSFLISSGPQFVNHIRQLIDLFGLSRPRIAAIIQKSPQVLDQCLIGNGPGIQMACLVSQAVGWPLFLLDGEPAGALS